MMKKRFLVAVLLLALSALPAFAAQKRQINFAGSSTAGTWYIFCGAVANVVNKYVPTLEATPIPSNSQLENLRKIKSGQTDFGLASPSVAQPAYVGEAPWKGEKYENIRAVFNIYTSPLHLVVKKDSPIKSVQDLKGKTIAGGQPGASANIAFHVVMEAAGMTQKDYKLVPLNDADRVDALVNGKADMSIWLQAVTAPVLKELAMLHDVRLIPLDAKTVANFEKKYPFYFGAPIVKGTVRGQTEDVPALTIWGLMVCDANMSEEVVYNVVKTVFDHKGEVEEIVGLFREVNNSNVLSRTGIPAHPGALRYFKEKGIKTD